MVAGSTGEAPRRQSRTLPLRARCHPAPRLGIEARSAPEDRQGEGSKVSRNSNPVRIGTPIGGASAISGGHSSAPAAAVDRFDRLVPARPSAVSRNSYLVTRRGSRSSSAHDARGGWGSAPGEGRSQSIQDTGGAPSQAVPASVSIVPSPAPDNPPHYAGLHRQSLYRKPSENRRSETSKNQALPGSLPLVQITLGLGAGRPHPHPEARKIIVPCEVFFPVDGEAINEALPDPVAHAPAL